MPRMASSEFAAIIGFGARDVFNLRVVLLELDFLAAFFLRQVEIIVAFVGLEDAVGDFDDFSADTVEKAPVVRDDDIGAVKAGEIISEPFDVLDVEKIGWLVEDEQIVFTEQELG